MSILFFFAHSFVVYLVSRAYFGNINFFGGPSTVQVKASARLAQILTENTDAMFVLLSDVWLDNSRVIFL